MAKAPIITSEHVNTPKPTWLIAFLVCCGIVALTNPLLLIQQAWDVLINIGQAIIITFILLGPIALALAVNMRIQIIEIGKPQQLINKLHWLMSLGGAVVVGLLWTVLNEWLSQLPMAIRYWGENPSGPTALFCAFEYLVTYIFAAGTDR